MGAYNVKLSVALVACNRPESLERGLVSLRFLRVFSRLRSLSRTIREETTRIGFASWRRNTAAFIAAALTGVSMQTAILPPNNVAERTSERWTMTTFYDLTICLGVSTR